MKNLFVLLFVVLFTACTGGKGEKIKIGITQIVEHESLDDVRRGVEIMDMEKKKLNLYIKMLREILQQHR